MPQAAIVLSVVAAAAAKRGADQKARAIDVEAKVADQRAERERQAAAAEADDFRRRQSRLLATSRALRAGSGVSAAGSPLLVDEATAGEIELGRRSLLNAGEVRRRRLKTRADLLRFQGRETRFQGFLDAASAADSTFLTAGGGRRGGTV